MPTTIKGSSFRDYVLIGSGAQLVELGAGNDYIVSYADSGEPDPAQTVRILSNFARY